MSACQGPWHKGKDPIVGRAEDCALPSSRCPVQEDRSEDNGLSLGNVCTGKLEHKGDVTDIVVNDTGATEERLEDVPSQ